MGRKGYILVFMILSWPVDNIHRLLNNSAVKMGHWYPFNIEYEESLQWYMHDVGHCLSYLLIFISIWLYIQLPKRNDADINTLFTAMVINQVLDLVHYIGWHRHSVTMLTIEGLVLTYASLKIIANNKQHGQARKTI